MPLWFLKRLYYRYRLTLAKRDYNAVLDHYGYSYLRGNTYRLSIIKTELMRLQDEIDLFNRRLKDTKRKT